MPIKQTVILIIFLVLLFVPLNIAGAADLTITAEEPDSGLYHTPDGNVIAGGTSTTCTIRQGKKVIFAASGTVRLGPGFHAKSGSEFNALISTTVDTDTDGMHDWWEITFGLDPQVNDAGGDLDGDGLTNGEEFIGNTLPHAYEAPLITLTADTSSIPLGGSLNLNWDIKYADSRTLSPGNISIEPVADLSVTPQDDTTYIITATGPGGTTTQQITIDVTQALPRIIFNTSFTSIYNGGQSTLSWIAINAQTVVLDGVEKTTSGELIVTPNQTTTYELIATNSDGNSQNAFVTITVLHHKPVATLSAAPIIVDIGQPTTLTWTSQNATSITIDSTPVTGTSGNQAFTLPSSYHEYTLVATGPGGIATAKVIVGDSTDIDKDGIPDAWEDNYGMDKTNANNTNDANDDYDGDLLTNLMEYNQGLDPYENNPDDVDLSGNLTGDHFSGGVISINSTSGQTLISGNAQILANCTIVITPEVRIIPGDGQVIIRGGDCDLLPDEWEKTHLNTFDYDGNDDPDGDGLTNDKEYLLGADPLVYDKDNDNDNLDDQWELDQFGNLDQNDTDDADNDGIDNWTENMIGTDPNDSTDYPKPGNYYEYDAVGRIKRIIRIK